MLKVDNVSASYGDTLVLSDVSLEVGECDRVAIIGSNGAGKSTILKTISGLLRPRSGTIVFNGQRIDNLPPYQVVKTGIVIVPEGRKIFPLMTVLENLELAGNMSEAKKYKEESFAQCYRIFPILREREKQLAGTLSGGEMQMLAIARSLMLRPKLLILDEPSSGLAPQIVEAVFEGVNKICKEDVSILIAEQNVFQALNFTNRAYVLENSKIIMEGKSSSLLGNKKIKTAYLGL